MLKLHIITSKQTPVMGKVCNPEVITRAIIKSSPHICFYKMQGEQHMRLKSSLTRERVKKDPAFLLSRMSANFMALASPLASAVYKRMPVSNKGRGVFQRIVGLAKIKLREGIQSVEVTRLLEDMFLLLHKPVASSSKVLPAVAPLKNSPQGTVIYSVFWVDESGRLMTSVFTQLDAGFRGLSYHNIRMDCGAP